MKYSEAFPAIIYVPQCNCRVRFYGTWDEFALIHKQIWANTGIEPDWDFKNKVLI